MYDLRFNSKIRYKIDKLTYKERLLIVNQLVKLIEKPTKVKLERTRHYGIRIFRLKVLENLSLFLKIESHSVFIIDLER